MAQTETIVPDGDADGHQMQQRKVQWRKGIYSKLVMKVKWLQSAFNAN